MVDPENHHFALDLVDSIQDAVGAAPGRVDTRELPTQGLADAVRVLDQCSGEELYDRRRNGLGQS